MEKFNFWPDWYIENPDTDLIGSGSFGNVYRICKDDPDLGIQTVSALKIVKVPQDSSEIFELRERSMDEQSIEEYYSETVQKIADEIKLLLSLKHAPNIISIEDYHIEKNADGIGYIIYIRMPLMTSLKKYAAANPLSRSEVIKLGVQLCDALTACEKKNIIHRDIKPANVFLDEYGNYSLGDFGIATQINNATQSMHSQKGTVNYMAPEILRGKEGYDRTVDIYSLGTMLYQYLNHNRLPYEPFYPQPLSPSDAFRVRSKRLNNEPVPLPDDADQVLGETVSKACAPDPQDRYQTASEMKAALLAAAARQGDAAAEEKKDNRALDAKEGILPDDPSDLLRPEDPEPNATIAVMGYNMWAEEKNAPEEKNEPEETNEPEQKRQEESVSPDRPEEAHNPVKEEAIIIEPEVNEAQAAPEQKRPAEIEAENPAPRAEINGREKKGVVKKMIAFWNNYMASPPAIGVKVLFALLVVTVTYFNIVSSSPVFAVAGLMAVRIHVPKIKYISAVICALSGAYIGATLAAIIYSLLPINIHNVWIISSLSNPLYLICAVYMASVAVRWLNDNDRKRAAKKNQAGK